MASLLEYPEHYQESLSDGEPDSDHETDDPDDPNKLLGTWLCELENLKVGLDNVLSGPRTPTSLDKLSIPTPRMDSYRFSLATLEDSQDIELDAILGELCALESQFDQEVMHRGHARSVSTVIQNNMTGENFRYSTTSIPSQDPQPPSQGHKRFFLHRRSSSGGQKSKFEVSGDVDLDDPAKPHKMELNMRTDSPDNDSAFSDSVSMLSSESSASSGGRTDTGISSQGSSKANSIALVPSPTQLLDNISKRLQALKVEVEKENSPPAEQAARIKAEKIRIALEKIKEASIKKIFIKAFSADDSAKSLLVDERMTVGQVCRLLSDKNHVPMDPRWTLVEYMPDLFMNRIYEDHEYVVENLLLWTRDSPNKLQFLEKDEKYDLFINPEIYLLIGSSSEKGSELDDDAKATLLEEFFSSSSVPEIESALFLKSDGKKAWKKHFFVLRASGIYYCPKGKSKLSKDLICLTTFEMNNVYAGFGWKKKYKAPTDFGFAIKHPQIQTKSSKYIKYLCAEDEQTLQLWIMGIRIAKFGAMLKENYDNLMRDIVEEDLETLAHARSFSVSSMAKTLAVSSDSSGSSGSPDRQDISLEDVVFSGPQASSLTPEHSEADVLSNRSSESTPTPTPMEWTNPMTMIRHDSVKSNTSSSSGCMSERSSVSTPTAENAPFEPEVFATNTLKRKPSMTPRIPLTNTTRSIAKNSDDTYHSAVSPQNRLNHSNSIANNGTTSKNVNRRFSLRRSQTDDQIMVNGIMKSLQRKSSEAAALAERQGLIEKSGGFPLPPPPLGYSSSIESLDIAFMPPPPPEAFRGSTTSLDSLPPPPPPLDLSEEQSWPSTSSLNSLPPPPSPQMSPSRARPHTLRSPDSPAKSLPFVPPKPRCGDRRASEADLQPRKLPFLAELKMGVGSISRCSSNQQPRPPLDSEVWKLKQQSCRPTQLNTCPQNDRRSSVPVAPTTLDIVPNVPPHSMAPPPPPPPPPPPAFATLPARNKVQLRQRDYTSPQDTSDLLRRAQTPAALPGQAASPIPSPPKSFLRDLKRVMEKKWKVARQLSTDLSATPSEILGFRDPCYLPPNSQCQTLGPSFSTHHASPSGSQTLQTRSAQNRQRGSLDDSALQKKRPPPPPPRRSDTTQLSRR